MSTTLVTFHVTIPRSSAAFVQLVGSWDNFSKPYTLQRDRKVGRTIWRTCPEFTQIVCDGERIENEPRDGGLQMGSTYWYFYLIDNDEEFADPTQPTTRACPFLPGQEVNVLDVPTMFVQGQASNLSSTSLAEYTLNPADKYAPIPASQLSPLLPNWSRAPPSTPLAASRPHSRSPSRAGSHRHPGSARTIEIASPSKQIRHEHQSRSSDQHSWRAPCIATDLRPCSGRSQHTARPRSSRRPSSQPTFSKRMYWLSWLPARNLWSAGDADRLEAQLVTDDELDRPWSAMPVTNDVPSETIQAITPPAIERVDNTGLRPGNVQTMAAFEKQDTDLLADIKGPSLDVGAKPILHTGLDLDLGLKFDHDHHDFMSALEQTLGVSSLADQPAEVIAEESDMAAELVPFRTNSHLVKTNSTRSRTTFSPSNATSAMFSRPITPTQTEFSVDFSHFGSPQLDTELVSKQVYSLEPSQHASALTLRTLQTLPDDSTATPTKNDFVGSSPANRRVEEWVDRSKTMLEELREDMGYLCALIE